MLSRVKLSRPEYVSALLKVGERCQELSGKKAPDPNERNAEIEFVRTKVLPEFPVLKDDEKHDSFSITLVTAIMAIWDATSLTSHRVQHTIDQAWKRYCFAHGIEM